MGKGAPSKKVLVANPVKVCEVLLIWKRRFLIRFVQHHSRWNVKLSWDFFPGRRGLGVFFECLGYWFQEHFANKRRFSTSSKSMHCWKQENMIVSEMASSSYTNSHAHVVLGKRQLPLRRFPSASFKSWPRFLGNRFLGNLWIKKRSFDTTIAPACPRHCNGPRLLNYSFWREHMIERMCGNSLHFPMLGFETGLERENG